MQDRKFERVKRKTLLSIHFALHEEEVMKNLKAKAVCVMLSASMAAMGLTGCGSDNVDGTKRQLL